VFRLAFEDPSALVLKNINNIREDSFYGKRNGSEIVKMIVKIKL
jgi:hypothetical protein